MNRSQRHTHIWKNMGTRPQGRRTWVQGHREGEHGYKGTGKKNMGTRPQGWRALENAEMIALTVIDNKSITLNRG